MNSKKLKKNHSIIQLCQYKNSLTTPSKQKFTCTKQKLLMMQLFQSQALDSQQSPQTKHSSEHSMQTKSGNLFTMKSKNKNLRDISHSIQTLEILTQNFTVISVPKPVRTFLNYVKTNIMITPNFTDLLRISQ